MNICFIKKNSQMIYLKCLYPQIEREVILSTGDKNSKVPILQEARKRGRLGAVAPDAPPKALSAWTHAEVWKHQNFINMRYRTVLIYVSNVKKMQGQIRPQEFV